MSTKKAKSKVSESEESTNATALMGYDKSAVVETPVEGSSNLVEISPSESTAPMYVVENIVKGNISFPDLIDGGYTLYEGAVMDLCTVTSMEKITNSASLQYAIRNRMIKVYASDTPERREAVSELLDKSTADMGNRAREFEIEKQAEKFRRTSSRSMLTAYLDTPEFLQNGEKNPAYSPYLINVAKERLHVLDNL